MTRDDEILLALAKLAACVMASRGTTSAASARFRGARGDQTYGHHVPRAWTPQDCSDSDADLFEGVIRR